MLHTIREHALGKPGVTEGTPFGPGVWVYKVADKMFLLAMPDGAQGSINLKCEPGRAEELREQYPGVTPGYHMSKKHWNTVALDGRIPVSTVLGWVDDSYALVVASLPRKAQAALQTSAS